MKTERLQSSKEIALEFIEAVFDDLIVAYDDDSEVIDRALFVKRYILGEDISHDLALDSVNALISEYCEDLEAPRARLLKYMSYSSQESEMRFVLILDAKKSMAFNAFAILDLYENLVCVRKYILEQS